MFWILIPLLVLEIFGRLEDSSCGSLLPRRSGSCPEGALRDEVSLRLRRGIEQPGYEVCSVAHAACYCRSVSA